jgi:cytosine/adenosine deaminase-related metal-dependent hydrolase
VVDRYSWSHSLRFGQELESRFCASEPGTPYIIHLGEGTDPASTAEIFELDRRNLLDARTVVVHGVALDDAGHDLIVRRGAALIWCPGSNIFTLGETLSPRRIDQNSRVALGSDSALTAGDLLDQVRIAHELGCPPDQIFDLVTTRAANVLMLENGEGTLRVDGVADIIAIPDSGLSPADTLIHATTDQIELVLLAGVPHLVSKQMGARLPETLRAGLDPIVVEGSERSICAPVADLLQKATTGLGEPVRFGGKRVWQ